MDFRLCAGFEALIVFYFFRILTAEASSSIHFVDSYRQEFFRAQSSPTVVQEDSVTHYEVGAAISILLGCAPGLLSSPSSSKLDEILIPNPFNRPRTVFMMEVQGLEASDIPKDAEAALLRRTLKRKIASGSHKADIELPEEEVSLISLDEHLGRGSSWGDKDISEFASWLDGSYVTDGPGKLSGELSVPSSSSDHLKLYMSKKEDLEFVERILILVRNARRISVDEDVSRSCCGPALLLKGRFNFIKHSEQGNVASQKKRELLFTVLGKLFDSFQLTYKGHIVGLFYFDNDTSFDSTEHLNVVLTPTSHLRQLVETTPSNLTVAAEVKLVRRTIAWLTAIILLIATLLGVHFLLNMPVARDTLLYSNAKID